MPKLTQAQATASAKPQDLRAIVSGNQIYIVAVLATLDQVGTKASPLPKLTLERVDDYNTRLNAAIKAGGAMMEKINGVS